MKFVKVTDIKNKNRTYLINLDKIVFINIEYFTPERSEYSITFPEDIGTIYIDVHDYLVVKKAIEDLEKEGRK